ncbi:MAG: MFS transporter [Longimicrobiales bacterium]
MSVETMEASPARPAERPKLFTRPIVSWALYDLANTIFSMNIVSLYLSLWVVNVMGGTDTLWARANSLSMILLLVSAPFLGAISDQVGRRLPFLLVSTLLCVSFTALLGVPGLAGTLILFVAANYFFQAGLIFYDSTLSTVSTPGNRGRVGGFGIGVGYIGSLIGVGAGLALESRYGYIPIFRVTALLFLIFALPIFLFVREPKGKSAFRLSGRMFTRAFGQVANTFRQVKHYRGLGRFLIGRAFYADAANTLIAFMGIYVTNEIGFSATQAQVVLLVGIASAVAGGFVWGRVVDGIGPKRTLDRVLYVWMVTLLMTVAIPLFGLPGHLFWLVAMLAGIALGGTWTADRPYMLTLAPPARIGEFYGLYSMVGRFAAVIGPLLWAFVAEGLGYGRPAAVFALFLMVALAYWILRRVDDAPRAWSARDMGSIE